MKYEDYYAALGVPRDADEDAIRKAYRKLARKYHPDVSRDAQAEARFKDIAQAYATLKDPEKRAAYDRLGGHQEGEEIAPPPQWRQQWSAGATPFDEADLADLLASLGRGRAARPDTPLRGRDHEASVRLTLEQAHRGATLSLDVGHPDGSRTLAVTVPAGVVQGQRLRLRGRGGPGRAGGADGDIYLHILLEPHPVFRPDGHDLLFDLVLAPWEAVLGADVEVPTLDGPVLLTVPAGTQAGRKLRLRGRGLAKQRHGQAPAADHEATSGRGDLYALVRIDVPATPTVRERELYKELSGISTFQPRKEALHASH